MSSEYYYLMHKNDIVTSLIIDSITGNITKVSATGNVKLIPFGGRKSSDELKNGGQEELYLLAKEILKDCCNKKIYQQHKAFLCKI